MFTFANLILDTPHGPFQFVGAEVPNQIPFGGAQLLDAKKMIGGRRRVNALGPDDDPLAWSGLFLGAGALDRARFLDSLRREGLKCTLSWDALRYTVVVALFRPVYKYPFRIPYSIQFEVMEDQTAPVDSVPITGVQMLAGDMARLSVLSNCIGDSTLNGLISDLGTAVAGIQSALQPIANGLKAVTTFISGVANCADAVLNSVDTAVTAISPFLGAASIHVQSMILQAEGVVAGTAGVVAGSPAAANIANSIALTSASSQLPELYEMRSLFARMQTNLPLVQTPTSAKTITVGGGDLYMIASQQYGDAQRWTDIAAANGLTDPNLTGIKTLIIPA